MLVVSVDCGDLIPEFNTTVEYNATVLGSIATVTCDLGYIWTDGEAEEHIMECMDTGCWQMVQSNATCQGEPHS